MQELSGKVMSVLSHQVVKLVKGTLIHTLESQEVAHILFRIHGFGGRNLINW